MKILGIETSCDETAICLIEAQGEFGTSFTFKILGNALYSQVAIHAPYGGVFPNLAKREHAKNLVPLLKQVLGESGQLWAVSGQGIAEAESRKLTTERLSDILNREPELFEQLTAFLQTYGKPDIDAIAVTYGPGLEPALWVGVNFARALSIVWSANERIPLVAVNHMEGHVILSAILGRKESSTSHVSGVKDIEFPILSLLISGGHTELVLSREWMQYERIGETRDDAAGEAFDKVARMLDLPYPGGPEISRLAAEARIQEVSPLESGMKFTPPMLHSGDYDFSFSGLKTEVRKVVEKNKPLTDDMKKEVALAFENAVAEVLVKKTIKAVEEFDAQTVVVGGGVSANTYIREYLSSKLKAVGCRLLVPPPELATDNALMIALAGYFHAVNGEFADPATLRADGNLRLGR